MICLLVVHWFNHSRWHGNRRRRRRQRHISHFRPIRYEDSIQSSFNFNDLSESMTTPPLKTLKINRIQFSQLIGIGRRRRRRLQRHLSSLLEFRKSPIFYFANSIFKWFFYSTIGFETLLFIHSNWIEINGATFGSFRARFKRLNRLTHSLTNRCLINIHSALIDVRSSVSD